MAALSDSDVLALWEGTSGRDPHERARSILCAVYPERDPEEFELTPLGRRDALLEQVRAELFGAELRGQDACEACGSTVEFTIDLEAVFSAEPDDAAPGAHELDAGQTKIRFRLPGVSDLRAAAASGDLERGREVLLERCLLDAERGGERLSVEQLAPELIDAVSREMARLDARADVQVALTCPDCGAEWYGLVDPGWLLWSQLASLARAILAEVHLLASAYGWTERDVLALSRDRRRAYLELVL